MSAYSYHVCGQTDEMGDHLPPSLAQCGICERFWCDRCDPGPSALCPYCHGRGSSIAPIDKGQARKLHPEMVR